MITSFTSTESTFFAYYSTGDGIFINKYNSRITIDATTGIVTFIDFMDTTYSLDIAFLTYPVCSNTTDLVNYIRSNSIYTIDAVWYVGNTPPATTLGVNNDFYLDDSSGIQYKKSAGSWGAVPLAPTGSAGGDLTGSYPNPSVVWNNGLTTYDAEYYPLSTNPAGYIAGGTGNLTEATSSVLTITGGTGAVVGSGTSVQVKQASTSQDGYLSSTDWTTFNNKQAALGFTAVPDTRTISTSTPLSGGGDLSANRTLSIADAAADGTTKGAAAFTASDFNATSGVISIDYTNGQAASASNKGFLTAADWSTFNGKQTALTNPVTGTGTTNEIAYFNGGGTIASLAVATYPSLTELSYVKGVTSGIQTQLGTKLTASKYTSTSDSTAVTSTTANTLATSQLITGGTFTTGNQLLVTARGVKTGSVGTCTMRIYVNTSSSLTGATLLASVGPTTAANLFFQIERNMFIKSATNTQMANTAANAAFDLAQIAAVSAVNIDWTTDKYIIFALQNSNNSDSTVISGYRILEY